MNTDAKFEALLDCLRLDHGFDFTGYKRSGLMRRVQYRMQMLQISSVGDYRNYLEVHPEEFALLFDTILINVTGFFRDASKAPRLYQSTEESFEPTPVKQGCRSPAAPRQMIIE